MTRRTLTENPALFARFAGSQIGHPRPLVQPKASDEFDYEGELAVVIGKGGRHIPARRERLDMRWPTRRCGALAEAGRAAHTPAPDLPLEGLELAPVTPDPDKIICVGLAPTSRRLGEKIH